MYIFQNEKCTTIYIYNVFVSECNELTLQIVIYIVSISMKHLVANKLAPMCQKLFHNYLPQYFLIIIFNID